MLLTSVTSNRTVPLMSGWFVVVSNSFRDILTCVWHLLSSLLWILVFSPVGQVTWGGYYVPCLEVFKKQSGKSKQ